ncbi:unnamed protein product, partial [Rotaria magnacalcarata]
LQNTANLHKLINHHHLIYLSNITLCNNEFRILFCRLHSLIKQKLSINDIFQSRTIQPFYIQWNDLRSARTTGYRQCVVYLLGNTRIRLNEFYPVDKLFDLFVNAEILTKEYIESFLRVYTICIDRNKIDASIRKSALEQMTIVMFLEIVSNLTHALGFLLFDQSLLLISLSDQEFQQQKFSIDFVFILIISNSKYCLLLLVTHDNVCLIDFNQLEAILDKYFKVVPSSWQHEQVLQSVFELLEQLSRALHLYSFRD